MEIVKQSSKKGIIKYTIDGDYELTLKNAKKVNEAYMNLTDSDSEPLLMRSEAATGSTAAFYRFVRKMTEEAQVMGMIESYEGYSPVAGTAAI